MSEKKSLKPTKKKRHLGAVLTYVAVLILSGCAGYFGADAINALTGGNDGLFLIYLALMLLGLYLALFTQIVVHEGGHLVFGLLTGYRFVSFNILGFIWSRDKTGKLRVGRMQIAGAGGQCLMAPPAYAEGEFPFTLYNLGGVLMNLISALVCGLLAWLIPVMWLRILLAMQMLVAVMSGLMNGLPIPVAAIQNDGKNLLCIRRNAVARRAFWLQMSIAAETARGVRMKDMPEEWFAPLPERAMDNPIVSAIAVMNASRLMDRLDFDSAEREIRTLLAREKGILGLYRTTMTCDGAVCELLAGQAGDLTESLGMKEHQQVMKAMKKHPALLRTQYALALLKEKDAVQAEKLLSAFEAAAEKHPYPQEITGERELIAAIQAAAQRGVPAV